jgi:uncharacterized membrane protein YphA (DoxX/SURF4 family)
LLSLHGFAGPLEVVGGTLIVLGLFTRFAAFILCGQMAVAYFDQWAVRGLFPIGNGGEEAVIFCFTWLWFVTAGGGDWGLDQRLGNSRLGAVLSGWEPWGRAIMRIVLAFCFTMHGYRHALGLFPKSAGRAAVVPLAMDKLPALVGCWEIASGLLLLFGLFTRFAAAITCIELAAAYLVESVPRGIWPLRNGGNETLVYLAVFSFPRGLWRRSTQPRFSAFRWEEDEGPKCNCHGWVGIGLADANHLNNRFAESIAIG